MLTRLRWLSCVCRRLAGATKHQFDLVSESVEILGEVFSPVVSVSLFFPRRGWLDFEFLLDTGATATILPAFIASELDLELNQLPQVEMIGVEGSGIKSWLGEVKMRIGAREFTTRCFFVDNPETPFLLGRADILDRHFSLKIDGRKGKLILIDQCDSGG